MKITRAEKERLATSHVLAPIATLRAAVALLTAWADNPLGIISLADELEQRRRSRECVADLKHALRRPKS